MRLYKPTTLERALVTQELREILAAEPSAPRGSLRKVQIVTPESPKLYVGIDKDPVKVGLNRSYKLPFLAPGAAIVFYLQPGQNLVAAAHEGFAEPSLLVEFIDADQP